jgi:hypothetical protein
VVEEDDDDDDGCTTTKRRGVPRPNSKGALPDDAERRQVIQDVEDDKKTRTVKTKRHRGTQEPTTTHDIDRGRPVTRAGRPRGEGEEDDGPENETTRHDKKDW